MKRLVLLPVLVFPLAAQAQELQLVDTVAVWARIDLLTATTVTAQCDDGAVVVGGGFHRGAFIENEVLASRPVLGARNGWEVTFRYHGGPVGAGGDELLVGASYALCMRVSSPTSALPMPPPREGAEPSDARHPQAPSPAVPADVAELKTPPAITPADLAALGTALPAHRVSAGTSRDLDERMAARSWMIESSGVVGMAIAGPCPPRPECSPSDDLLVMWYDDGTLSETPFRSEDGGSLDPIGERQRSPYRLPAGQRPGDIVGIGISGGQNVTAWYRDGTSSTGSIRDLGSGSAGERYTLPPGKTPADIVGLGKAPSNGWAYAWYADGTVSAGTDEDLDAHRTPYPYTLPPDVGAADVLDFAIGHDDWVFAWYR